MISSGTFVIDGMAWCVACEKQLAASEAAQHQSTRAHETALALWEVTDDEKMSGKKRKQVEKVTRKKQCTSAPVSTVLLQPHRQGPVAQFAVPPLGAETFIELGLQEHSLLWDRIGDFMQATVTLSHARDAAVKGDLAQAQACFDAYITTISSLLQAADPSPGCHPLPSDAAPHLTAPASEGEVESVSVPVNTSQPGMQEIGLAPSSHSLEATRTYDSNAYEGGEENPELDSLLVLAGPAEMDLEQFLFGQQQTIEPKVVEGDAEDEHAVQQLLALTIHDECEKEHDIAAIVRLGLQAAQMLTEPGYSLGRMSTNGLLSALGVPKSLHFPEDSEDRLTYYFQVKEWLALKRGDFTRAVFGVCSNLHIMVNLPDEHPILVGERADLVRFLRWAEPRFRPNFVRLWRAALPRLHGSVKTDIARGLVTLLEKEAKWYDQHSE